jgi:hypothetical protein
MKVEKGWTTDDTEFTDGRRLQSEGAVFRPAHTGNSQWQMADGPSQIANWQFAGGRKV